MIRDSLPTLSHLASSSATKPKARIADSLENVISSTDILIWLTFQFPNLMSCQKDLSQFEAL